MTKHISKITLLTAITIATAFSTIILWNLYSIFEEYNANNNQKLKQFYTKQQKGLIQNEVSRLIQRINATRNAVLEDTKQNLRDRVNSAEAYIENINFNHVTEHGQQHISNLIASFTWNHNTGYFYIISKQGTIMHHGGDSTLAGKSLSDIHEQSADIFNFLNSAITNGEAFAEYDYYPPDGSNNSKKKLGYAKYNKKLDMLIGSGIYFDTLKTKVQNEILETVKKERFGYNNYGYFWIFDTNYNTIFHIDPNMYSRDMYTLKDTQGKYVVRELLEIAKTKGEGFTSYYWNIPGKDIGSEKVAYVSYFPEWNWVIGSGFYYENFHNLIATEEAISQSILADELTKNGIIIFVMFTGVVIISLIIFNKIKVIEHEQQDYVNDLLQYKTVIDTSAIVSITNLKGEMMHVNDQMCNITGFSADELIGMKHNKIGHPDNPQETYRELWGTITKGDVWRGIIKNLTKDGGYFYQKTTITPFKNKEGIITNYIAISHDVTELFENKSQLQKYLHIDPLTELENRASLLLEIKNSRSGDLAIIDIDGFHKINETFGMKFGDTLLKSFANRLSENVNLNRYNTYRLHSDVFAVFSNQSDKNLFITNVENAVKNITKDSVNIAGKDIIITSITGYAHGSDNILAHADAALQFAKANNISHYVYNPLEVDNTNIYQQNTIIVKMISNAIDEDRVVPFFQPIAHTLEQSNSKYECLMRIINQDGSVIPPADFLDISKQTRFYPYLTKIIAGKSIDAFSDTDIEFSINISAEDLLNHETMDFIYEYANEKGVFNRMILEIVESESLSSYSAAITALYKFKLAGAKIAIDDFGTGYSNFDYLLKIKADYIKIDGSIIKLINKDERAVDIVQSIISYASKLKMETIAEFISDQKLAETAKKMGVDYLQGYYIGKPSQKLQAKENIKIV
ncbi:diguanylate cyclase/phosphodiesterase with PAS/PAC sensor(s) [Denitrovibrio acetiphilus DSM 12809]|uniref:Diguanylate cyclase/phosphodiesterase with PAS/PAC sensor(S) n=1 Tax=Denitrovibrio acetiphilus (strain DSM 12809 / NBRC 114555 / N2460) TaxID=522772 RepID=D4H1L4_DENA2|nr:cache domain-containing protein [Denitrovibrio acetiphilus]ADD68774.1 diguanylate cyclase/phosphodiesterase with PAS/PAC sensor(s) [Denitrovibrio acetiphilus DSM 12809]